MQIHNSYPAAVLNTDGGYSAGRVPTAGEALDLFLAAYEVAQNAKDGKGRTAHNADIMESLREGFRKKQQEQAQAQQSSGGGFFDDVFGGIMDIVSDLIEPLNQILQAVTGTEIDFKKYILAAAMAAATVLTGGAAGPLLLVTLSQALEMAADIAKELGLDPQICAAIAVAGAIVGAVGGNPQAIANAISKTAALLKECGIDSGIVDTLATVATLVAATSGKTDDLSKLLDPKVFSQVLGAASKLAENTGLDPEICKALCMAGAVAGQFDKNGSFAFDDEFKAKAGQYAVHIGEKLGLPPEICKGLGALAAMGEKFRQEGGNITPDYLNSILTETQAMAEALGLPPEIARGYSAAITTLGQFRNSELNQEAFGKAFEKALEVAPKLAKALGADPEVIRGLLAAGTLYGTGQALYTAGTTGAQEPPEAQAAKLEAEAVKVATALGVPTELAVGLVRAGHAFKSLNPDSLLDTHGKEQLKQLTDALIKNGFDPELAKGIALASVLAGRYSGLGSNPQETIVPGFGAIDDKLIPNGEDALASALVHLAEIANNLPAPEDNREPLAAASPYGRC